MEMDFDLNLDAVLNNLISGLEGDLFFCIISSENGVVKRSYINEEDFNKASISLNISQLYELAEEITASIGVQDPDFNLIHSGNYYVISIKLLDNIIILLTMDQIEVKTVFEIINQSAKPFE